VFLAHFTGGGIDSVLDLPIDDFWDYLIEAVELYKTETINPKRVVLSGIEKK
jgi:hypothetical protein